MFQNKLKEKDINLLEVYGEKTEPWKYEKVAKYAIPPLVIVLVFGGAFGYFKFQELAFNKQLDETNAQIDKIMTEQDAAGKQEKYDQLQLLTTELNQLTQLYNNMNSYPEISKQVINGLFTAASTSVDIRGIEYTQESGIISLSVRTNYLSQTDQVVRRLKETGLFEDVTYPGYTSGDIVEAETPAQQTTPQKDIATMTDEELRQYLADLNSNTQQNTNDKQVSLGKYYDINITCVLKKVVSE